MINEQLQKAFSKQINYELYSEYLYLMMKGLFKEMNLSSLNKGIRCKVHS